MIRGKMSNDGPPDPFEYNQTPATAMEIIQEVSARLDRIRTHKIQKYNHVVENYAMDKPVEEGVYRIYDPPPLLSKLIRFRVSLEVYRVSNLYPRNNTMVVDIAEIGNPQNTKRGISLKQLVLVKTPIEREPPVM